jgi:biotin carboxyl carrier protein
MSYVSLDSMGSTSPPVSPITSLTLPATGPLSNPFPLLNGVLPQPVGRDPNFSSSIQGLAVTGRIPGAPYPYVEQWNFNIQQQLSADSAFQLGYQGSRGTHQEISLNVNQLPDSVAAQAAAQYQSLVASGVSASAADAQTFANQQIQNPLVGKLAAGSAYNGATVAEGQLLRPYPQFGNATNAAANVGESIYHSLQATYQKRFRSAGTFFVAYTWSKLIGDVDTKTGFLDANTTGGIQDNTNLAAERSLESFDVPHRLILTYSLQLPVGKGQRFLPNIGDGLGRVVEGWRVSSVTTFQSGYPIALTATANDLANSFGAGTIRPNQVAGCNPRIHGSATSRLQNWFNTACFAQAATPFSFGDEPRVDSRIYGEGIDNWDLSLLKETKITGRVHLSFEADFLNAFNRVQFAPPGNQVGGSFFGAVTATENNPREIQFASRMTF